MAAAVFVFRATTSPAEPTVAFERQAGDEAHAGYAFTNIPRPATNDAATGAKFVLVEGRRDPNGGTLDVLHDGRVAVREDQPSASFFFGADTTGGRIWVDLGKVIEISRVSTYSWHLGSRGPQVYVLYASDGKTAGFDSQPAAGVDPVTCGWRRLARVDTRPGQGRPGGQYGVSIVDSAGTLGAWQHLLFDIRRTEDADTFGNTFYTEVDVVDARGPALEYVAAPAPREGVEVIPFADGRYRLTLDVSETPDLAEWARQQIVPMIKEWYPRLVTLLPSDGFVPPKSLSLVFSKDMQGVANTSGTRIRCSANWIRKELNREARGALFHELVHVVQQYGQAPRSERSARPPLWLTEGLTDYLRFYVFEPETKGAEIGPHNAARARYDGSYRVTANFLNWTRNKHDQDLPVKLNAAIRDGRYGEKFWEDLTGKTVQELGDEWKASLVPAPIR